MVTRIGGLASGLDIDSIVLKLMQAERVPLDKLNQQRQVWKWKQEDYRTLNSALAGLRDSVFNMKLESTFLAHKASSSNTDALTVTAGTSANNGIYTMEIEKLAKGIQKSSSGDLPDETETLVDGTTSTRTLAEQFSAANGLDPALTDLTGNISLTIEGSAKNADGSYKQLTVSLDTSSDNIYKLVSDINDADLGIKASYDSAYNRFFLVSTNTGADQHLKVVSDAEIGAGSGKYFIKDFLKLGVVQGADYTGQNAEFTLAGSPYSVSSNTVTILGMNMTLKAEPPDPMTPTTVNIVVSSDSDTVYNNIKSFVDKYNEMIGKINTKLQETYYRDYPPLTDEQKNEMSDKEIELWEEKSRSGLMKNDSMLGNLNSKIRAAVSGIVSGLSNYTSLSEIGITTKSYEYLGQLTIDEDKLKTALNSDSDGVYQLFANSSAVADEKGIAVRVYDEVVKGITLLSSWAGASSTFTLVDNSFIGKKLSTLDKQIDKTEERLTKIEERYWRQFAAMEKALSQMNAQSTWLSQQMGSYSQGN